MEKKLASEADKKGLSGKKKDQYVWGTMNNIGAVHGNKISARGRAMEKKHEAKMAGRSAAKK